MRLRTVMDEPNASGTAAMIKVLARLYHLTGDDGRLKRAERTAAAWGAGLDEAPLGIAGFVNAAEARRCRWWSSAGAAASLALLRRVFALSLPTRVLLVIAPGSVLPEGHPARGKGQEDGAATAYVCRGQVCSLPATDAAALAASLAEMRRRR